MVALALHIGTVLPLSLVVEPCLVHVHKDDIMKPSNVGQQPARPAQVDQCLESIVCEELLHFNLKIEMCLLWLCAFLVKESARSWIKF